MECVPVGQECQHAPPLPLISMHAPLPRVSMHAPCRSRPHLASVHALTHDPWMTLVNAQTKGPTSHTRRLLATCARLPRPS